MPALNSRLLQVTALLWLPFACSFPDYRVVATAEPSVADACDEAPCQNDGRCVPVDDAFVCLCKSGFLGDRCEQRFSNCSPDPCRNGAVCVEETSGPRCQCLPGWDGSTCEHDVDDCVSAMCGDGTCVDRLDGYICVCPPGVAGSSCDLGVSPNCRTILENAPEAISGVYSVDPDGQRGENPPFEVECDMVTDGGGWTKVGEEAAGEEGSLRFLGISVGDPGRVARHLESGLFGERFEGAYGEVRLVWKGEDAVGGSLTFSNDGASIFVNTVDTEIPIGHVTTTDSTLQAWLDAADGAHFCRAAKSPDVRPGNTSWAVKPADDHHDVCGCNSSAWAGRGAFYEGSRDQTFCGSHGGGWAGAVDDGQVKSDVLTLSLQIWVR
ncbi:MAG TPA: fibrinogen-like YCDxxxxGGGW domain-containing protein [Polyangiaceae bacterium]|nr:fibrinogen-like YCDxxxxGGGW domain-containing protein [Polyangiaceae bacterium]